MDWNASWIWHPDGADADNFYVCARKALHLGAVPRDPILRITASSLYKLYINGEYVGRGPNPSDPSRYYYDVREVGRCLRQGENVFAVLVYNYGPKAHGILGQNWGRGGLLVELRAPGEEGGTLLVSDGTWRVLQSPSWRQDTPVSPSTTSAVGSRPNSTVPPIAMRLPTSAPDITTMMGRSASLNAVQSCCLSCEPSRSCIVGSHPGGRTRATPAPLSRTVPATSSGSVLRSRSRIGPQSTTTRPR